MTKRPPHSPLISHFSSLISPKGFTLTELLVVVAIIAILASLITVAARAGIRAAQRMVIKTEITSVGMALEAYKNKHGEYPPDFTNNTDVERHLQKRWPRYSPGVASNPPNNATTAERFCADIKAACGWDFNTYAPDSAVALAFWLGGLPDANNTRLSGFSTNPTNPFDSSAARETPIYEISQEKGNLLFNATLTRYPYLVVRKVPVAYFRGTTGTTTAARNAAYLRPDGTVKRSNIMPPGYDNNNNPDGYTFGIVVPYAQSLTTDSNGNVIPKVWQNSNSFQLIHPGLDEFFSGKKREDGSRARPVDNNGDTLYLVDTDAQTNMTPADLDNIVNFSDSATIDGLAK